MAPKKLVPQRGGMSGQLEDLQLRADQQIETDDTQNFVESTYPERGASDHDTGSARSGSGSGTKRKGRGKNKNNALAKLGPGQKMRLEFNEMGKVCSSNGSIWSRHIGIVVRDPTVISHRLLHWADLSSTDVDHLWRSIANRFEAVPEPIDHYWQQIMEHVHVAWDRFRCDLNRNYIKPHDGDVAAIKANVPEDYSQEDWDYILERHFLKDDFKIRSARSSRNRQNMKLKHHAGSVSFSQIAKRMERDTGNVPSQIDLFYETHSKKGVGENSVRVADPPVQEKIDEMQRVMDQNQDISQYELTESVFGRQGHGRVIGMGSGVRPTRFREDLRVSQSQRRQTQNEDLERMRQVQDESNTRIEELESRLQEQSNEKQRQLQLQRQELEIQRQELEIQRQEFQNQSQRQQLEFQKQLAEFMSRFPPPPPPES